MGISLTILFKMTLFFFTEFLPPFLTSFFVPCTPVVNPFSLLALLSLWNEFSFALLSIQHLCLEMAAVGTWQPQFFSAWFCRILTDCLSSHHMLFMRDCISMEVFYWFGHCRKVSHSKTKCSFLELNEKQVEHLKKTSHFVFLIPFPISHSSFKVSLLSIVHN